VLIADVVSRLAAAQKIVLSFPLCKRSKKR